MFCMAVRVGQGGGVTQKGGYTYLCGLYWGQNIRGGGGTRKGCCTYLRGLY